MVWLTKSKFLSLSRFNVCILFTLIVSGLLFSINAQNADAKKNQEEKIQEFLKGDVALNIRWKIENDGRTNQGSMRLRAHSLLKLNKEMSSIGQGLPAVMVCYKDQGNSLAYYSYEETITIKDPPEDCRNPIVEKYEGAGSTKVRPVPGPGNLIINHFASLFKDTGLGHMAPPDISGMLVDHYVFAVPCMEIVVDGYKIDSECKKQSSKRKMKITPNITGKVEQGGKMGGSEKWPAKFDSAGSPPWIGAKINEMPAATGNNKPFSPKKTSDGNVTYSLSWNIEELKPHVLIYRLKDNDWHDITDLTPKDEEQEIFPGEKLTLKAVAVIPGETGEPPTGAWEIAGKDSILKEWTASEGGTKEIPVDKFDEKKIEFFWWKEIRSAKVKYTVKNLTGKTEFKFMMPKARVETTPGTDFTLYTPDDYEDVGKCVISPGTPGDQGMKIISSVTIEKNKPFCLQYIQLAKADLWKLVTAGTDFVWHKNNHDFMLDTSYPYNGEKCSAEAGPVSIEMIDTPTADLHKTVASIYMDEDFKAYLMFRPGNPGDGNAWVPLKHVNWGFQVNVISKDNPYKYRGKIPPACGVRFDLSRKMPPSSYDTSPQKTVKYPVWRGVAPTKFTEPLYGPGTDEEKEKYKVPDDGNNYKNPPPQ